MFRRNHAVAESNAADILFAMKRVDEALARERRSLAVYEAQATADPANAVAQNDRALGYSKIAQLLDSVGKTADGSRRRNSAPPAFTAARRRRPSQQRHEAGAGVGSTIVRRRCRRNSACASRRSPTTPARWTSAAS